MGHFNETEEEEVKRFKEMAEQGTHSCENCHNNTTEWEGQCCNAEDSDFPKHPVEMNGKEYMQCGSISYEEEKKPRNCPKWTLRTKSEREESRESMAEYFRQQTEHRSRVKEERRNLCICSQCPSTLCPNKKKNENGWK